MNRHLPGRRAVLRLEPLEGRETPAGNLIATFAPLTHTLTVVGDDAPNDLTVVANASDSTQFTLFTSGIINGGPSPYFSPTGVQNLTIRMLAGDDQVTFAGSPAVALKGSLSINGGDGTNTVTATGLTVGKGFTLTNGAGFDTTTLTDMNVGGALTVRNGDGGSTLTVNRSGPGMSVVRGSVLVANGVGSDHTALTDLNVGGGVTVQNGHGDAGGVAGATQIYNQANVNSRSQIRGSVLVSYLDGNTDLDDVLADAEVGGNVTFAHGPGSFRTDIDARQTTLPVIVRGNLTVGGAGANEVNLGTGFTGTGLVVGMSLFIATEAGADTTRLTRVQVDGATVLKLGDGVNTVLVNDSLFAGAFRLTTGSGADTIHLDADAGYASVTTFRGPVVINEGAGTDDLTLAGSPGIDMAVVVLGTFVVHHGAEGEVIGGNPLQVYFPFGTAIQYLV